MVDIKKKFTKVETSDLPSFDNCETTLDMALHILWASKDVGIRKLSAQQVSSILRDAHEVSIETKSISKALNRAGRRIHTHREGGEILYEIMKAGKNHLMSLRSEGTISVLYFAPEQRYSSKRLLASDVLNTLSGELRIVDPYFGERTLDVIKDVKARPIKFLTRIENITNNAARNRLMRELQDFKTEKAGIEFRNYPNKDLHDRYIVSPSCVVLIGHSMKDLGTKESFAVVLNEASSKNIYEALSESFGRRWKQSDLL